jgi:hypothetical protein
MIFKKIAVFAKSYWLKMPKQLVSFIDPRTSVFCGWLSMVCSVTFAQYLKTFPPIFTIIPKCVTKTLIGILFLFSVFSFYVILRH